MVGMTKFLYKNSLNSIYHGNLSVYEYGKDYYYITQSSINKSKINEKNIIKVPLSNDSISQNNNLNISKELMLHDLIIKDRIKSNIHSNVAVIHCHSPYSLAYMGLESYKRQLSHLYLIFPELKNHLKIGKNIPKQYEPDSKNVAMEVMNSMRENNIIGHENHGIISVSNNLQTCYDNIELLEFYCRIYNLEKK